jgi:aryl-alcohol dehydrogenase-like predicted oxidoreductase
MAPGGFITLLPRLTCWPRCHQHAGALGFERRTVERRINVDYRLLGASGFKVSALGFGAGTFGGKGPLFSAWGNTDVAEARRLIDICLEAGLSFFDTADVYSDGASESILGAAIKGRRDEVVISTKVTLRAGPEVNAVGASKYHLIRAVDKALQRLGTDYIDLLQLHQFDAMTPVASVMSTLDDLVRAGKIRFIGASNFSGWQLMKSQAVSERYGYAPFVANQVYYSLIGRDYEWELMPLGLDQGIGAVVWSPLGWGRLTGRLRRGQPVPAASRLHATASFGPPVDDERLYRVVDVLDEIVEATGKTIPQIALNWVLQRPTVATVLIGARDEKQLRENLGAIGWQLSAEQMAKLDAVSAVTPPYPYYPYWSGAFTERAPPPVAVS